MLARFAAHHVINSRTTAVQRWFSALLTFVFLVVVADATSTNVYTSIGGDVSLPCSDVATTSSSNVIVDWFDYVHNNVTDPINVRDRVKTSADYRSRFQITTENTLRIQRLNETDAGYYICVVRSSNVSKSYMVTVYSVPHCFGVTSLSEGDTSELKCNSTFFGVLSASKMQWVRRDVSPGSEEVVVGSRDLFDTRLAERSVRVPPVTRFEHGTTYTCRITLDDVTECQLVLSVAYPVRDLEVTPVKEVYQVGDEVQCSASGNPRPKITLHLATDSNAIISGTGSASLIVQASWRHDEAHPLELKCSASNTVDGIDHVVTNSLIFSVADAGPKKGEEKSAKATAFSVSIPIVGGIVIGVVILVAILLAVVCMRICKDRKNAEALKTPPPAAPGTLKPDVYKNENAKKGENHH